MGFEAALVVLSAYLIGSLPCGFLLAKLLGHGDIRKAGSGNIGATNAFRVGGKFLGVATLLLDVLKGWLAVYLAQRFAEPELVYGAAFAAVFGHIFPIWLKFKGGKGVATTLAVVTTIEPLIGVWMLACWVVAFGLSRISSLSSIIAIILTNVLCSFYGNENLTKLMVMLGVLILFRHKENILRLIKGEEGKIR